jgi:arsenite methyltransferase
MTDEMLELARANAAEAGVTNVEFVKGFIEDIPLPDGRVDVIVSNCVLNLSGDKRKVLAEAAYTGCIAGALTEDEFREGLEAAGFDDIEIRRTHRVHEHASSAIIRARKPNATAVPALPATLTTVGWQPEAPVGAAALRELATGAAVGVR